MTGRKKYGEGLEQLMIQSIQHHLWNMVEQCEAWAAWLPVALGYCCLVMMRQKTEAARWILKCVYYLPRFSQMEQSDWAALHSTNGRWPKTYSKSNPGVFEGKTNWIFCNGRVNLLISTRLSVHFTCWRQNWRQKDPQTNNNWSQLQ